jgi:hypothetical protein
MFFFSFALTGWRKLKETSAADIYIILSSLDLEFVVFKEKFIKVVYAAAQPKYSVIFAIGLVVSLVFLAMSSRVQKRIAECRDPFETAYPYGMLFVCWAFALPWIAMHFFIVLAS